MQVMSIARFPRCEACARQNTNRPFYYLAKCLIADRAGHLSVMQSLQSWYCNTASPGGAWLRR
jgi:hypothetical protein